MVKKLLTLSKKAVMWIYTAVVSQTNYLPWLCGLRPKLNSQIAGKNLHGLFSITRAMKTTSTSLLETLLALPPMDLFIKSATAADNIKRNFSIFENNFLSIIPSSDDWLCNEPVRQPDRAMNCFTDGSRWNSLLGTG